MSTDPRPAATQAPKPAAAAKAKPDKPKRRTGIVASEIDAAGNVTLWDHGPSEPKNVEKGSDEYKRLEAEAKAWHEANGKGPIPIVMHASEAVNAVNADPRYTLDALDPDDPDVVKKMEEIAAAREASAKASAEHAARAQYLADLKLAIAAVMAERRAAADEAHAPHDKDAL